MRSKPIVVLAIIFVVSMIGFWYYNMQFSDKNPEVLKELEAINPDQSTVNSIKNQNCQELEKSAEVWTVKNCKNGVYFKVFMEGDGYILGHCTEWTTQREAFLELKDMLGIKECTNITAEDKLSQNLNPYEIYEVCGLNVVFREGCIVGVARI